MKTLNVLIVVTLMFWSHFVTAQGVFDIAVVMEYQNGVCNIRWVPGSHKVWQEGMQRGYTLLRSHTDAAGEVTIDTVLSEYRPMAADQWPIIHTNNDNAEIAHAMMFDDSLNDAPEEVNNLAELLARRDQEEGKYLFALVAAQNDFEVAKDMALGYSDSNVIEGETYTYIITVSGTDTQGVLLAEIQAPELILPEDFTGEIVHGEAMLNWEVTGLDDMYVGWMIERATNDGSFELITDQPYIHSYSDDKYEYMVSFADSLQECQDVKYRVYGVTCFGTMGPYTEVVEMECPQEKMEISVAINGTKVEGEELLFKWDNFDDAYQNKITGFNVYYTRDRGNEVVKVNNTLLPASERVLRMAQYRNAGYFILEAIDINGDPHRSRALFYQLPDEVPPSAPVGVTGNFGTEHRLDLEWEANTEEDFNGYYIFVSDRPDANFKRHNPQVIKSSKYSITVGDSYEIDNVYIAISAIDISNNVSDRSEVVAFERPDVWAPVKPILNSAQPTNKGIALSWELSGSSDVVLHKLQARLGDTYKWKDIIIMNPDNTDIHKQDKKNTDIGLQANYVDAMRHNVDEVTYRIIAVDDGGNEVSSDWITTSMYHRGDQDAIQKLKLAHYVKDHAPSQEVIDQLNNIGYDNVDEYVEKLTEHQHHVKLIWSTEITSKMEGFKIYRARSGDGFAELDVITRNHAANKGEEEEIIGNYKLSYVDDTVEPGHRYSYYVVALYDSGEESGRSKLVSKKIN